MPKPSKLTVEQIRLRLESYLEVEFSFRNVDRPAAALAALEAESQYFVLDWIRRIASTHIEIAYQFCEQSHRALEMMDAQMIEAWVLLALDVYDQSGLHPALNVIQEIERFVQQGRERASGCAFEDEVGVLLPIVQGLSGRRMKLELADSAYTDSEVIYLPPVMAHLPDKRDNFRLYKATMVHLWAQARFGTFHIDLERQFEAHPAPRHALRCFHQLETVRLEACIRREFPGLDREMQNLRSKLSESALPEDWHDLTASLKQPDSTVQDTLALLDRALFMRLPEWVCFQGELIPGAVNAVMAKRIEREKAQLRVALKDIADEINAGHEANQPPIEKFDIQQDFDLEIPEDFKMELALDGKNVPIPEHVRETMISIIQDLSEIPEEYLVPAGSGEYNLQDYEEKLLDPDEVWSGTYHEKGAFHYQEWDFRRKHYRKDWCVVREVPVKPVYDGFVDQVLVKYQRLIMHLRKSFEAMRNEDHLLKRQVYGDGIDIDAFVEAWADVHTGLEMTDRLFTRMHREDRNIAVMFMVDMSGSTQGWINEAEREALVLLAESLESLGDRYAIYGFTGMSRKRCDVFPVKTFDERYDEEIKARISGIRAGDYTRMGAAIRHLSVRLNEIDARTKLLVTLSDGKPDDYLGDYRSEYGIEDTRQALFEARRNGIHAFCITIDEEGQDYLPHMYGAANYTVINEVEKLPLKVSDIYKKITT
ncbi:MAG: nitric oxide reductase activation protein [Gammaproteobacteria bacterium]|nr:nitric oxide reductase activation protein [Gammaproteobacteria bacterium]